MTPRACLIIPVYRHLATLPEVLEGVEPYGLPCVVVDDGNQPSVREALSERLNAWPWVQVLRLPTNQGKGVASLTGSRHALQQGFTHAIFMDADGQHDSRDIPRLLEEMRRQPRAMILGRPLFDETAPLKRRLGRIVSNVWVWIETWSLEIRDSLCGFHCLPLQPIGDIDRNAHVGRGMDFDADILVRLFWYGVPVVSVDTRIAYPAGGISNFHLTRDNLRLCRMHTRLFFGMLRRIPTLIRYHWRKA